MKSNFCNQDVINEVAEKVKYPKFLIKGVEKHWHHYVHSVITSGSFENVLVPYLVKVEFNQRKMDAINNSIAKKEKQIK